MAVAEAREEATMTFWHHFWQRGKYICAGIAWFVACMIVLGIIGLLGVDLDDASVIPEVFTIIGLIPLLVALLAFIWTVIREARQEKSAEYEDMGGD